MAEYARGEINAIGGYYAYGKELIDGKHVFDYDVTKLLRVYPGIGLTGIEVYDLLRDEYDIQIEFGDIGNILAYISIGDRIQDIERLVGALEDIRHTYQKESGTLYCGDFIEPECVMTPQKAFMQKEAAAAARDSGSICAGIGDVLSSGNPDPDTGRADHRGDHRVYFYAKEKGCSFEENCGRRWNI